MKKILSALAFLATSALLTIVWLFCYGVYLHVKADHLSTHLVNTLINYNIEQGTLKVPPEFLPKPNEAAPAARPNASAPKP